MRPNADIYVTAYPAMILCLPAPTLPPLCRNGRSRSRYPGRPSLAGRYQPTGLQVPFSQVAATGRLRLGETTRRLRTNAVHGWCDNRPIECVAVTTKSAEKYEGYSNSLISRVLFTYRDGRSAARGMGEGGRERVR